MKRRSLRIVTILTFLLMFITEVFKGFGKQKDSAAVNYVTTKNDSVTVAPGDYFGRGILQNLIFGEHYRDIWHTEVRFPVFNMDTVKGGLEAIKRGGGLQTTSVHFIDSTGRRFVLRSVDKEQGRVLPGFLKRTFIKALFQDAASAQFPYSALLSSELSRKADLRHTNPVYYVIPDEERISRFGPELIGRVAMFEEKPNSTWAGTDRFGNPEDIIDSDDFYEFRFEQQNVHYDPKEVAAYRLFDLMIGDWDRHGGQWEWIQFNKGDSVIFKPFPRDRDMAFFNIDDGLLPFIVTRWWGISKMQSYHHSIENFDAMLRNSLYFDKLLLTELSRKDWLQTAEKLQASITEQEIESAVKNSLPDEVYVETGEDLASKLKHRRKQLSQFAINMYERLSNEGVMYGTDEDDNILVNRKDNSTEVIITGENGHLLRDAEFFHEDTDLITIYALDGSDNINVKGDTEIGVKVKVYGGKDKDDISDQSVVKRGGKKTIILDSPDNNDIAVSDETLVKLSSKKEVLEIDREGRTD